MLEANMNRATTLRATRRTLHALMAGIMLAGVVVAAIAVSMQEVMLLVLLLMPLLLLMSIALGVIDAAEGEKEPKRDSAPEFPRPLELRG